MKWSQTFLLFLFSVILMDCQSNVKCEKHIFYLHGQIVELQGVNAVSKQFGEYRFKDIIDSLKSTGAIVYYEIRTTETDFQEFCENTSDQINRLIETGVETKDISVVGASKGAIMAMNISSMNSNQINYVLLAANNDFIEAENNWNLHGHILGIYEESDSLAGNDYSYWIKQSPNARVFKQIELHTGLGHGFLYAPIKEWLDPTKDWIRTPFIE